MQRSSQERYVLVRSSTVLHYTSVHVYYTGQELRKSSTRAAHFVDPSRACLLRVAGGPWETSAGLFPFTVYIYPIHYY